MEERQSNGKDVKKTTYLDEYSDLNEKQILECLRFSMWSEDEQERKEKYERILEWLHDSDYLNEKGKEFFTRFWQHTYHNNKKPQDEDLI